ncbi:LysR family transcriptional regulator [Roseomonas sp. GC11]|uniref:LysR family transcriptional regulator n=1 Tax=Roseomonas sp. GC11 TaxID=2950546 RepID=UPI00210C1ABD|nr:LysR family transcriptional regulator [Roseomonas sp. GC11]MCQ4158546.1 LysR family transcriptional regulator [Roseomonas sp. GC11]
MPDISLDFRYLKYALSIADFGSFRRAAHHLGLSQSTLSRRVQMLESRLGIELFERNRKGVSITEIGHRFLSEARLAAEVMERANREVLAAKRGHSGQISVGLITSLEYAGFNKCIESFVEQFPDIDVYVEDSTSESNINGVIKGSVDIALISGAECPRGCDMHILSDDKICVAISMKSHFVEHDYVLWNDLKSEKFLVSFRDAGPDVRGIIIRNLSSLGFFPKIVIHDVGRDNLLHMVGSGLGITLVPLSATATVYPKVKFVPIKDGGDTVVSSLVWRRDNKRATLKNFISLIQSSL